ncbi:unnamed protein product [Hymenolepis diminuta]|uniref:Small integral membrane protein 8 n=1 Tax=Hymenolepis diminuta TaxID=6216 RepID=A0A0R3SSK2_HYMDI|nr:unnamed protein product [Hymenolepis diminuta]VUZ41771.1 unnamed protein product [Hymenolepis diminuta]
MLAKVFSTSVQSFCKRWASSTSREIRIDPANGQLPYSTTNKWHAAMNFLHKPTDIPRYHYPIILTSVLIFAIYFGVLREKNEYDLIFEQPPPLPKPQTTIEG